MHRISIQLRLQKKLYMKEQVYPILFLADAAVVAASQIPFVRCGGEYCEDRAIMQASRYRLPAYGSNNVNVVVAADS